MEFCAEILEGLQIAGDSAHIPDSEYDKFLRRTNESLLDKSKRNIILGKAFVYAKSTVKAALSLSKKYTIELLTPCDRWARPPHFFIFYKLRAQIMLNYMC